MIGDACDFKFRPNAMHSIGSKHDHFQAPSIVTTIPPNLLCYHANPVVITNSIHFLQQHVHDFNIYENIQN